MKKYGEYLSESLVSQVAEDPSSNAAAEAKKLGLTYIGFGRYTDGSGGLTYTVQNDKLVPFKGKEDIAKSVVTARDKPNKDPAVNQQQMAQAEKDIRVGQRREKQDQKFLDQTAKEVEKVHKALSGYYNDGMFGQNELDAIDAYTSSVAPAVNLFLYKGFDVTTDPTIAEQVSQVVDNLDAAFENTEAPMDYTVYTGLSARYNPNKMKEGEIYSFRGYISGSLDHNVCLDSFDDANSNGIKTILQIEVHQGQKAIYVDGLSPVAQRSIYSKGQKETILPRGSKAEILSGPHMLDESILGGNSQGSQVALFHCVLVEDL